MRYRRKVTEAEGIVWDGKPTTLNDLTAWGASIAPIAGHHTDITLYVHKGNARVTVHLGDVVMREADGSGFYPVAADVLRATYEAIGDDVDEVPAHLIPSLAPNPLATVTLRRVGWRGYNLEGEAIVETEPPLGETPVSLYVIEGLA
jgi:hypothetical protein